jgi:hypothetical protein
MMDQKKRRNPAKQRVKLLQTEVLLTAGAEGAEMTASRAKRRRRRQMKLQIPRRRERQRLRRQMRRTAAAMMETLLVPKQQQAHKMMWSCPRAMPIDCSMLQFFV